MLRPILLFVLLFAFSQSKGQIQLHDGSNQGLMRITTIESDKLKEVEGSPYLEDMFRFGMITTEDADSLKVFLRYNVHQDQMEIKLDPQSEDIFVLPKDDKIVYFLGEERFQLKRIQTEEGYLLNYFSILYDGDHISVLKHYRIEMTEPVKARTGYEKNRPAEIVIKKDYYLDVLKGPVKKLELKNRKIKVAFNNDPTDRYLAKNKVKDEKDLIELARFVDQNL